MSLGGGGETKTKTEWREPEMVDPVYRENQYRWVTPTTDVLGQQIKDIGEQSGWGFGNKNMFGSGVMADAIARRLGESAIRATTREQTGQWMYPQAVNAQSSQNSYTSPQWSVGMGG